MKQIWFLLFLLFSIIGNHCAAQVAKDTPNIVIHSDPRLALVVKKHEYVPRISIRSGRGFRVQIYSGNDRGKATQAKIDFIRRYPSVKSYMSYIAPTFRVKVGDYHTRMEAQKMYQQVIGQYNPCMIVPDIVEFNSTQHDEN